MLLELSKNVNGCVLNSPEHSVFLKNSAVVRYFGEFDIVMEREEFMNLAIEVDHLYPF